MLLLSEKGCLSHFRSYSCLCCMDKASITTIRYMYMYIQNRTLLAYVSTSRTLLFKFSTFRVRSSLEKAKKDTNTVKLTCTSTCILWLLFTVESFVFYQYILNTCINKHVSGGKKKQTITTHTCNMCKWTFAPTISHPMISSGKIIHIT